jgi:hypothetical protein
MGTARASSCSCALGAWPQAVMQLPIIFCRIPQLDEASSVQFRRQSQRFRVNDLGVSVNTLSNWRTSQKGVRTI